MPEHNSDQNLRLNKVFNPSIIRKGIIYFLSISVLSLVGIFLYTNSGKTLEVWSQIKPIYLLISFLFVFVDLFLGAYRNHIFVKEFKKEETIWVSVKANLANIFMGAVTPSQSGGGLAQVYVYYKNGLGIPNAVTISFINWISTLLFFPIAGILSYIVIKDHIPVGFITYLAQFAFSIFTILIAIVLIALFFPNIVGNGIIKMGYLLGKIKKTWLHKFIGIGEKTKASMIDYRSRCMSLLKRKPQLMAYSFLLTVLLYLNKFVLGYILVLALGVKVDFLVIISIEALIQLLLYFAPSPGGSGIAEFSTAGLMAGILSPAYIATFTLLHRSLLVFIPAIIGAFVVVSELNNRKTDEEEPIEISH